MQFVVLVFKFPNKKEEKNNQLHDTMLAKKNFKNNSEL